MIKARIMSATLSVLGIIMITVALVLQSDTVESVKLVKDKEHKVDVADMASSNRIVETTSNNKENKQVKVEELSMEEAPQAEYIPPRVEVYENMTMEELAAKLDKNLGSNIAGKGSLIASKSIELGVDPYVATAIMLHETGCKHGCSSLVQRCNNVGGQKGYPSCGGSYKYYASIDEGIIGHIENLNKNYYSKGLNTVETIGPRYAQSNTWVPKINWYVNQIRAS